MRITFGQLRSLIREALAGEFDMDADHTSPWYKSPGRAQGSDGDPLWPENIMAYLGYEPGIHASNPFRPDDPAAYIGLKTGAGASDEQGMDSGADLSGGPPTTVANEPEEPTES